MKTLYRVYKWVNVFSIDEWKGLLNFTRILKKPRSTQSERVIKYLRGISETDYNEALENHIHKVKTIYFGRGAKNADKTQFANKIRFLIDFIESYSIYLHTNQDKQYRKIVLKDILQHKGFSEETERIRKSFLTQYEKAGKQGIWQLYQQFEILHQQYHDAINNVNDSKKGQEAFKNMSLTLDEFLIIAKLRVACEALTRNTFLREKHQVALIAAVEHEASYLAPNSVIIQMYLQVLRLIKGEADWSIKKLNTFFKTHKDQLYIDDLHFLLLKISSYINAIINNSKDKVIHRAALDFYRMLLNENYLKSKREIYPGMLINIIALALSLNEFDFADKINNRYSSIIRAKERDNTQKLLDAMLADYQQDWTKMGNALRQIQITDIHIGTAYYNYSIKCAYEDDFLIQEEKEWVLKYCKNFENYLNRQEVDKEVKEMYDNMIKIVRQLVKKDINITKVRQIFDEMKIVASKKWLSQKIEILENQKD